jgi:hypothetical protein
MVKAGPLLQGNKGVLTLGGGTLIFFSFQPKWSKLERPTDV